MKEDSEPMTGIPIREFSCAKCGKFVYVRNRNDKRTRFCCRSCEKRYWRHPQEGRRQIRIRYDGQRHTSAAGGIRCSQCRHCYAFTDGSGRSYDRCRLTKRDFFRNKTPKRHPTWCPLLPKNRRKDANEKS